MAKASDAGARESGSSAVVAGTPTALVLARKPPRRSAPVPVGSPDVLLHQVLLGVSCGVLILAVFLRVDGGEQVVVPVIEQSLPGVCTYKRLVGIGCPGCGLTRCFVSLAHGDPSAAWQFNPAGLLLFTVVVVQVPYRSLQLWRIRRGFPELRSGWISQLAFWSCFGTLVVQWLLRTFLYR